MKLDPARLMHLRQIARDRKAAFRAAHDDRLDLREKVQHLERDRARMAQNYRPRDAADALDEMDKKIAAAREELTAMQDRVDELASASSTDGQAFQRAVEHAREVGLDLPDDLRPRTYGAPAAPAEWRQSIVIPFIARSLGITAKVDDDRLPCLRLLLPGQLIRIKRERLENLVKPLIGGELIHDAHSVRQRNAVLPDSRQRLRRHAKFSARNLGYAGLRSGGAEQTGGDCGGG